MIRASRWSCSSGKRARLERAPPRPTMQRRRMERANPDLGRWLRSVAQRSGLRTFWRWWLSELAPLMPAGLRTALRRRRLHPVVAIEREGAVLWAPRVSNGALAFNDIARI